VKYFVTGGAGFIGSNLCKRLLNEGHTVYCVDYFYTGNKRNIQPLLDHKNFMFYKHDVLHFPDKGLDEMPEVDVIFHLASPAIPKFSCETDVLNTLLVNSVGTLKLLEFARERDAQFFFTSSSEVYGGIDVPQCESDNCTTHFASSRCPYTESKRFGETAALLFHKLYGLDVKIARIFNTYGPNMKITDGLVIPKFMSWALKDEDIVIYDSGSQTRSFCFVSDMVEGLLGLSRCQLEACCEPVNLGNPKEHISIYDLAVKVKQLTGSSSKIVFKPGNLDEQIKRQPSIKLAQSLFNWEPLISLDLGLQSTLEYIRRNLED